MNQQTQKSIIPQLLLLYLIWGFNWVVMRVANDYYSVVFFVAMRFSIGAVTLLFICAIRGKLIPPRRHWRWIAISGVLAMALNNLISQFCTGIIGAGLTSILIYMQSIFVCLLAIVFLGEKFTIRKVLGILLSAAGLFILMNVEMTEYIWAIFLALGGAAIKGSANIIVKWKLSDCDMIQCTAWQMACGAFVLLMYLLFRAPAVLSGEMTLMTEEALTTVPGICVLLYNGLLASALAFLVWNYTLTKIEAGKATIAIMGVPAVGVLSGVLVLDEPMSWSIAFGMILVITGILIVLRARR